MFYYYFFFFSVSFNCSFKTVSLKSRKMSGKQQKSHKAMSDAEWISRLKKFASTGIWPSNEGNRPAPRQKKWYEIYQRVSECLLPLHDREIIIKKRLKCLLTCIIEHYYYLCLMYLHKRTTH